ncbi:MAG TPA: hypothetical protein VMZ24_05365 [Patescibacteria group bacterium]|nr:hypothetical protein [Patescibacteria group bacterium]
MEVTDLVPPKEEYQPTSSQLDRASEIRRFNFRFVYLPIVFISLVFVLAILGLLYLALFPPTDETAETISGIADAFTILGIIPLLLLCAIFPTLWIGAFIQGKRRGMAPLRQLQLLLWRLDGGITSVRRVIQRIAQKLANPVIIFQAFFAFVRSILHSIARLFKQG